MTAPAYPRLLIVSSHVFNPYTGGGLALTNYFKGWPQDRIAEVYNDSMTPDQTVCRRFYRLGPDEIRWPWPLSLAYSSVHSKEPAASVPRTNSRPDLLRSLFQAVMKTLGGNALLNRITLSPRLKSWIQDFQPDVLFTQLGDLPMMGLILEISNALGIPITFQIPDNWLENDYRRGLFSFHLRRKLLATSERVIKQAALRYGISEAMCDAYQKRFGVPFKSLLNPVDLDQWKPTGNYAARPGSPFIILYVGTIVPNSQLESLQDLKRAVIDLNRNGESIQLKIFTTKPDRERYRPILEDGPHVLVLEAPPSKDLPDLFAGADLLSIPVNFSEESLRYIRYSIPGKIPAYMASGRPILVFGPAQAASVRYAMERKWGYVVHSPDLNQLKEALKKLKSDEKLRTELGKTATALARQAHDARRVRDEVRRDLLQACGMGAPA